MKVCVIGLGYVGLTLSMAFVKNGIEVFGVDSHKQAVATLKNGISTIEERDVEPILKNNLGKKFTVSEEIEGNFDNYVICVGTPLDSNKEPMLKHVKSASEQIGSHLKKGNLVILRSTVPVDTTRKTVIPIIEKKSRLKAGQDFDVAFAPERTIEGAAIKEIKTNPQIIGAITESSLKKAKNLFEKIADNIVPVSNVETAEMIKLIDNTYRDSHFAISNEIALICEALNLNAHECISKANFQYTRNNIPTPSPGVGGPCLSKDPYILSYVARQKNYQPNIILHSRLINEYMPYFLAIKILNKIKKLGKDNNKMKIFVIGFAFKGKPETGDIRDSSTLILIQELKKHFQSIFGYDPAVPPNKIQELGIQACSIDEGFENANCIIFMNNNEKYLILNIDELIQKASKPCIIADCWNMFESLANNPNVDYTGIGFD